MNCMKKMLILFVLRISQKLLHYWLKGNKIFKNYTTLFHQINLFISNEFRVDKFLLISSSLDTHIQFMRWGVEILIVYKLKITIK